MWGFFKTKTNISKIENECIKKIITMTIRLRQRFKIKKLCVFVFMNLNFSDS